MYACLPRIGGKPPRRSKVSISVGRMYDTHIFDCGAFFANQDPCQVAGHEELDGRFRNWTNGRQAPETKTSESRAEGEREREGGGRRARQVREVVRRALSCYHQSEKGEGGRGIAAPRSFWALCSVCTTVGSAEGGDVLA